MNSICVPLVLLIFTATNACKGENNNDKDSTADTAKMPADETLPGKASTASNASQQKENASETKVPYAKKNAPEKTKFNETANAMTQSTDTTPEEGTHLQHETNWKEPTASSHQTADVETKVPSTEKTDEGPKTSSAEAIDENTTVSLHVTTDLDTTGDTANLINTSLETTKTETRVSSIESNAETTNTETTGLFNETTDAGEKAQLVESDNKDSVSHSKDVTAADETTSPHKAAETEVTATLHETTNTKNKDPSEEETNTNAMVLSIVDKGSIENPPISIKEAVG
ncbi:hypothetical protein Aperf_G00000123848 [Anoplocephala perfoliata]